MSVEIRHAHREIYPEVSLKGWWGRDLDNIHSSSTALFTPQHQKDAFQTWRGTCEDRAVKFRRWLDEFKVSKRDPKTLVEIFKATP